MATYEPLASSQQDGFASSQITFVDEKSEHNPGIFQEGVFVNSRGLCLRVYAACRAASPKSVVVYHHGIRMHGLIDILTVSTPGGRQTCVEGSIAELYLDAGFAVYTYDCEGHGLSDTTYGLGYFRTVWDLVDDLVHFVGLVRKVRPGLRVFLAGSSMGAGICVGAATKSPESIDGMILAAPMVSVEKIAHQGVNKVLVPIAPMLLRFCPCVARARWAAVAEGPDQDAEKTFREDPLTDSATMMMNGPAFACLLYCQDLVREVSKIKTPFLTMHAREDTSTDYEGSEILMENAATSDKTLLIPPAGSYHALFQESCSREWAREKTKGWLRERCA